MRLQLTYCAVEKYHLFMQHGIQNTSNNTLLQGWYLLQAINCTLFCMVSENMDMKNKFKE